MAPSRKAARQFILHRHLTVNDKVVNIGSYLLKPGDVITVRENSKKLSVFHDSMKRMKEGMLPNWLSLDKANLSGKFLNIPERTEIPFIGNEQLVVELYSK